MWLRIYGTLMFFIYVLGIPMMYIMYFWKDQKELQDRHLFHRDGEVSITKMLTGNNKLQELKKLVNVFTSDLAIGKGPDAESLQLLIEKVEQEYPDDENILGVLEELNDMYETEKKAWNDQCSHHQLSFLFSAYKPRVYWFEVVEVIRRLSLSGLLVLFGPGSTVQSAFSILICFGSIVVYSMYKPLKDEENNNLQYLAQLQLFLVLLTILLLKVDSDEDSQQDQTYVGLLLVAMTIPGYIAMVWMVAKEWFELGQDVKKELGADDDKEEDHVRTDHDSETPSIEMTSSKPSESIEQANPSIAVHQQSLTGGGGSGGASNKRKAQPKFKFELVRCPPGMEEGQSFKHKLSDGRIQEVTVPSGVEEGDVFKFRVDNLSATSQPLEPVIAELAPPTPASGAAPNRPFEVDIFCQEDGLNEASI